MRVGFYTAGRVLAVGTKPLYLFTASNFLAAGAAAQLAANFLFSALMLIVVAAGPERMYYSSVFLARWRVNGYPFHLYFASTVLLILAGAALDAAALFANFQLPLLALTGAVFFASEKLADERLRWFLFQKEFESWGKRNIVRGLLQLASFAVVMIASGSAASAPLLIAALALCNVLVFAESLPRAWPGARLWGWLATRSVRAIARNRRIWLVALLTASVGYIDRFVILFVDQARLPIFMLVVMCFSIVYMALDFYYVSRHRRDFLERRITIAEVLRSRDFVLSYCGGMAAALAGVAGVLLFSVGGRDFPYGYVIAVALFQSSIALAIVPREIIYWGERPQTVSLIEGIFWGVFVALAAATWLATRSVGAILTLAVACASVRLYYYLSAARRVHAAAGSTLATDRIDEQNHERDGRL